jgi:hypothetical protein
MNKASIKDGLVGWPCVYALPFHERNYIRVQVDGNEVKKERFPKDLKMKGIIPQINDNCQNRTQKLVVYLA